MDRLPTPVFLGLPCGSADKESACNVGDVGSIPGLGRSPGEGNCYPLQYPSLEKSTGRGTWQATAHGVTKSQTQLSDFDIGQLGVYDRFVHEVLSITQKRNT